MKDAIDVLGSTKGIEPLQVLGPACSGICSWLSSKTREDAASVAVYGVRSREL